ncbi:polysaccharide biosynthesis protein [Saccharibacillus sp. CPCC 101409]|uniref:putative polysaccharide biosynthesis protein n=1 Tax=Saccharibacillus sp. CPCC 101409 TaxID=3058041 RepID=UPI0026713C59|nr:polysaccharide biosynthesis protein [Saccharibacillus sp. CPCC 101409]MDO3411014.1 polysaccharide biosynthesis protein [Saccharibacillus sp. CPCC 101409]
MSKKESFVKGTLILAAAALVARVLGLVQRVPLEHMLGSVGNASFTVANTLYLMLLTVATAGIPSTLSKMISERYALDRPEEAGRIYYAALLFSGMMGVVITVLLYVFAPWYASVVKLPEAVPAIRALAPALILFPTIAMMRGYFQGRNMMAVGGVSQIVEQIARVFTAILLAYILLKLGRPGETIAAGASFGGVLGSLGAFGIMLFASAKLSKNERKKGRTLINRQDQTIPLSRIYADIFKLSIPIVLSSLAVPAINFIDTTIVKPLLIGQIGDVLATAQLGILGSRAQSVAGIPPILAIALSTSLIPIISAAFARKDVQHMQQQITMALRTAVLTGMPMVIALGCAAYSVNGLLFSTRDGSGIIAVLTLGTIFQITMMITNSMLLGMNLARRSMVHVGIGLAVKLLGSLALAPFLGIYGIIGMTGVCFLVITMLNLRVLRGIVSFSVLGKRWPAFAVTCLLIAAASFGLSEWGIWLTAFMNARIAFFIACCAVGAAVPAIYLVLLVLLRVIRRDELGAYPRPLQRVLRPLMRLQRG